MYSFITRPVLRTLSFTTGRRFAKQARTIAVEVDRLTEKLASVDAYVRDTGRVPTRDFMEGLNELTQSRNNVTPIQGLLLLRCCGSIMQEVTPEKRNELAEQIWTALIERGVRLDISHYNALLRIYLENGKQFDPFQFLEDLESKQINPNRVTFQRIIHHLCVAGQMEAVAKLLLIIKQRNIPLTESIFNSLIVGHIKIGGFNGYQETLETMARYGLEKSSETYAVILASAAGMMESDPKFINFFHETLKECESKGINLSDIQKLEIAVQIPQSHPELFDQLISQCDPMNYEYSSDCYNSILELVNLKKIDFALKLLKTSKRNSGGHFMIRQMVKVGIEPSKVKQVCDQLKQDGLNSYGLSTAVETSFELLDLEPSRQYLKYFIDETGNKVGRPHYYWPLLTKCQTDSQVLEVLLKDMASMDKSCSARSFLDTFEEYVWTRNIRDVQSVIDQMKIAGYPTSLVLTSLVNHHLQNDQMNEALHVLESNKNVILAKFIAPNLAMSFARKGSIEQFVSILKRISGVGSEDEEWIARCLLQFVKSDGLQRVPVQKLLSGLKGIQVPAVVFDVLKEKKLLDQQHIDNFRESSSDFYTKSGNEVTSVEQLENQLIELKSKGLNTRGCLRLLILAYCKKRVGMGEESAQMVKRVEELVEDLQRQNFMFTDGMHASLLGLYANHGVLEKALEMKQAISSDFQIDNFKILDLATCMIKNGKREEAFSLMEEEGKVKKVFKSTINPEAAERNVYKILNAAAEVTRDPNYVDELLQVVLPLMNVKKPTNVMMGPVVKVHLLNDDLRGALDKFVLASSNYGITPWRGEIMKRVIEMDDPVNLQLITDISVKHHGESQTLAELAAAFVKAGKIPQASKVVNHPSFVRAQMSVYNTAERMVQTNEIEHLEKFVEVISKVSGIERDPLYFQLIRGHALRNQPDKALDVWTTMQEHNVVPSAKTLRYLGSLLEESGLPVPFDYSKPKAARKQSTKNLSKSDSNESNYAKEIQLADLDEVLNKRKKLIDDGQSFHVSAEGSLIERLLASDRFEEAMEIFDHLMQKGLYPTPRVLKQVIQALNKKGEIATMKSLEGRLPEELKNQSWYTNQLAFCYINAGKEEELLNDIFPTLKPFPLSALLSLLQRSPDSEPKALVLARNALKADNFTLIYNMVWVHRMISHRFKEAENLLNEVPQLKESLLFQTLVNKIKLDKDIELADALIPMLGKTNLMGRKIAIIHSAKIDALNELGRPEEAEQYLTQVINEAKPRVNESSGEVMQPLTLSDFNRMTLVRLQHKIIEVCRREPNFPLPPKRDEKLGPVESQRKDELRA